MFAQVGVGRCSTVVKRVASGVSLNWFESWLQHLLVLILLGNVHKIESIMVPISQVLVIILNGYIKLSG